METKPIISTRNTVTTIGLTAVGIGLTVFMAIVTYDYFVAVVATIMLACVARIVYKRYKKAWLKDISRQLIVSLLLGGFLREVYDKSLWVELLLIPILANLMIGNFLAARLDPGNDMLKQIQYFIPDERIELKRFTSLLPTSIFAMRAFLWFSLLGLLAYVALRVII